MNGTGRNSPAVHPKGRSAKLPGGLIAFQLLLFHERFGGVADPLSRVVLETPNRFATATTNPHRNTPPFLAPRGSPTVHPQSVWGRLMRDTLDSLVGKAR